MLALPQVSLPLYAIPTHSIPWFVEGVVAPSWYDKFSGVSKLNRTRQATSTVVRRVTLSNAKIG
jgi:hypothetical protein